jgi:hypothetical protein
VGAAYLDDDIVWWENLNGSGTVWAEHAVDLDVDGAESAGAVDMDDDGDLDIFAVAFHDDDVAWWENTDGNGTVWTKHFIDRFYQGASSIAVADIDGDGDLDAAGTGFHADDVTWWENVDGLGTTWTEHTLNGFFDASLSVQVADLNGDGLLDILAAGRDADAITWWENDAAVLSTFYPPVWTNRLDATAHLLANLTNAAVVNVTTQLVVAGWARTGSAPNNGPGSNTDYFDLTNDTAIVFDWTEYVLFSAMATPGGHIIGASNGWYLSSSVLTLTATPHAYFTWSGWTGDVMTTTNPLVLTNDRARSIWAAFSANLATNDTPEWWLALHSWTNNFDAAAMADWDNDGMPTWQEWAADTSPTNGASVLQMISISFPMGGMTDAVLQWQGGIQARQYLERSPALGGTQEQWSVIFTNTPPTPVIDSMLDPMPGPRSHYRIRAKRP